MKRSEILRVAKLCLHKMCPNNEDAVQIEDESDLQVDKIQSLWGGMGHIYKVSFLKKGKSNETISPFVLKHVAPPRKNMSFGDLRKAASYLVESSFYEKVAPRLIKEHGLSLPEPYWVERDCGKGKNEIVIAMSFVEEDASGHTSLYSRSHQGDEESAMECVLTWLATLHAAFWGHERADHIVQHAGLQRIGCYWHLDTRLDEHASMPNQGWEGRLKKAARAIDERLKRDSLQCIIHGDAKEANILVSKDRQNNQTVVTLCDFQYCGKGAATKDLAYFFCSSVSPDDERAALEFYLQQLTNRLSSDVTPPTMEELQDSLELAYCDFFRFMAGWGYWGAGGGGVDRVKAVLHRLDGGKDLGSEQAYEDAVRREYG